VQVHEGDAPKGLARKVLNYHSDQRVQSCKAKVRPCCCWEAIRHSNETWRASLTEIPLRLEPSCRRF
jgi:hypothetical protein